MDRWMRLVLCLALIPSAAIADGPDLQDGNFLHSICFARDDDVRYKELLCSAYIRGLVEGLWIGPVFIAMTAGDKNVLRSPYCVPSGATFTQLKDVVLADLAAKPEDRHLPASMLVYRSLNSKFPCNPTRKPTR